MLGCLKKTHVADEAAAASRKGGGFCSPKIRQLRDGHCYAVDGEVASDSLSSTCLSRQHRCKREAPRCWWVLATMSLGRGKAGQDSAQQRLELSPREAGTISLGVESGFEVCHLNQPGQEIDLGCQKVALLPPFSFRLTYTCCRNIACVTFVFLACFILDTIPCIVIVCFLRNLKMAPYRQGTMRTKEKLTMFGKRRVGAQSGPWNSTPWNFTGAKESDKLNLKEKKQIILKKAFQIVRSPKNLFSAKATKKGQIVLGGCDQNAVGKGGEYEGSLNKWPHLEEKPFYVCSLHHFHLK